ncbi:MAG: formylmethanofuran dehydrogenase subunit A [Planctomycetota bacterium]|nr:formylmethanofuran dehydrogenase subunit A [Planctomycetota bacterium]
MLKIQGGTVYDPANGIDGKVLDLWIDDGKIVQPPADPGVKPSRIIDASGLVVMPGGIDMHCHIAGPKVNVARKMRPEEKRVDKKILRTANTHSGTMGSAPSTFATGYTYAGLGYTTAFDAAIPPLDARHVHEEFADTPCLDKGFYVLVGNNHYVMQSIQDQQPQRLQDFLGWLLGAAKGYAPKLVNPGGVEVWKHHPSGNVAGLDSKVDHFDVTPRQIIRSVARAGNALGLPHPVHIHCNNLGMPGNWVTTLETMKALEGHRGHLTHIQFHSYGGGEGDENTFNSKAAPLVDYVNQHENLTIDVGQVMFGKTTSMTGDGPLGYYLANVYGSKWFSGDTEMESGCGIAPIEYRNKSLVHSLQWGIGLDWFLMMDDPWRVVMSTDHPNGASFRAYPQIVRLLMDRTYRQDMLKTCHKAVRERCNFPDIDREYTLGEIAIITRAGPARILGLQHKGHLAVGADADITVYTPHKNKEIMFEMPRYVIKGGQIVIEDTELRTAPDGRTLHVAPQYDQDCEADIGEWFEKYYSIRFRNYPVTSDYMHAPQEIACGKSRV